MAVHYSAFISYRHHPEDIRAATQIQHGLERFPIPRGLKKQNKRIDRVFRDKEELPITSDINENIEEALRSSDYLIVICSTHTRESVWVQREIDTFLKYRDRSRILTVLVDGEPYEVIPKSLLEGTVTDPETGLEKTVSMEPLSCDWRHTSRRQRYQEELPRLAAALLECNYDELRQRQRQHRQRRLMGIFSGCLAASVALAGYFLYNSIRIQKANLQIRANYEASLRNQSMYLAAEAREQLAAGDRLLAIALARAALPGEDSDRPFVPEAEYVLTQALGVYNMRTDPQAVGAISLGANARITELFLSEDGRLLVLYDTRKLLTFWDTQTMQQTGSVKPEGYVYAHQVLFTRQNNVVLADGAAVYCYSPQGTLLWQQPRCYQVAFFADDDRILALRRIALGQEELVLLRPEDGQVTQVQPLPERQELLGYSFCLNRYYRQQPIVLSLSVGYGKTEHYLLDLTDGSMTSFLLEEQSPTLTILEDGRLLSAQRAADNLGYVENTRVTEASTDILSCYSLRTGQQLWKSEITTYTPSRGSFLGEIPGGDRILYATGASFMVFDGATGALLTRCDAGSSIVSCQVQEKYATAVLEDGYICNFWYQEAYCYETKCFMNDLSAVAVGDGYVTLREKDNRVTLYRPLEPAYEKVYDFLQYTPVSARFSREQRLAEQDGDGIRMLDLEQRRELWRVNRTGLKLLGFAADGSRVYAVQTDGYLLVMDAETGSITEYPLPTVRDDGGAFQSTEGYLLREDTLYYILTVGQDRYLCRFDPAASDSLQVLLPQGQAALLAVTGDCAWVWSQTALLSVALSDGRVETLLEDVKQAPVFAVSDDASRFALAVTGGILLKTAQSRDVVLVSPEGQAGRLFFLGEELLAVCDDGCLLRYDGKGQLYSKTALDVGSSFASRLLNGNNGDGKLEVFPEEGRLLINVFGVLNIIDPDTWTLQGSLENCVTYLPYRNAFLCRDTNSDYVAFPFYSTRELLELAAGQLADYMLTGAQKADYGLN